MPQPSLIQGAMIGGETRAYQGNDMGEQMVRMAEAFTKVKMAKQEQAGKKLELMLSNVDKLPIDEKAIRKTAKQAGIPLADDDTIMAIAKASQAAKAGAQPQPQGQGKPLQVSGPGGGVLDIPGTDQNAMAKVAAAQKKWQNSVTPDQAKETVLSIWIARARQLAEAKFKDEKAKLEYATTLNESKTRALAGDAKEAGKLMAAGEIPFNITQLAWNNATPEAKKTMYDIALGHETEAQRSERKTSIFNSLMQHGMNAQDAYGLTDAIADGKPLSIEQQSKMGQKTFKQLGEEAEMVGRLQELGVPSDKLQGVAQAAILTGSIVSALPKGLQPVFQKELELKSRQLNIQAAEVAVQQKRTVIEAQNALTGRRRVAAYEQSVENQAKNQKWKHDEAIARLSLMEVRGENTDTLKALQLQIKAAKDGVKIDDNKLQPILDKLNIDKETFDYLSGVGVTTSNTVPSGDPMKDELGPGGGL